MNDFDCENICVRRCAGPCQARPTTPRPAVTVLLALVCAALVAALAGLAVWGIVYPAVSGG